MARRKTGNGEPTQRFLTVAGDLTRTGVKTGEMGVAAAQTIGYRTAMMAAAMNNPIDLANPEFVRMGSEKVEAMVEATHAVAKGIGEMQQAWMTLMQGQLQAAMVMVTGLGQCRNPADLMELQRRTVTETVEAGIHAALYMVESATALTQAGMTPAYRTVRANARRLAKQHG
ncbi:phasin family protein [Azospirillum argentinense]|uniref:Phasin family protein n=1 Tax=Azospirillum brasilense TaxID=192 RepID=A0A4D8PW89_AZOBR|nr:phasin family protein [Azospirillum argentinense]QCO02724.1 phasin family protein [Azospirillum argentinense]